MKKHKAKIKNLQERASDLLDELPRVNPQDLPEWNLRAQTLCVFAEMERICTALEGSVSSVAN
jgi:hypothetical protein